MDYIELGLNRSQSQLQPAAASDRLSLEDKEDDKRDADAAGSERLRDERKTVISIGWGEHDGEKNIQAEGGAEPLSKD